MDILIIAGVVVVAVLLVLMSKRKNAKEWSLSPVNPDSVNFDQAAYDAYQAAILNRRKR